MGSSFSRNCGNCSDVAPIEGTEISKMFTQGGNGILYCSDVAPIEGTEIHVVFGIWEWGIDCSDVAPIEGTEIRSPETIVVAVIEIAAMLPRLRGLK